MKHKTIAAVVVPAYQEYLEKAEGIVETPSIQTELESAYQQAILLQDKVMQYAATHDG